MIIENKMSISSLLTSAHLILTGVGGRGGSGVDLFGTFIFCIVWAEINLQLYQSQTNYFQQQNEFLTREKETLMCLWMCRGKWIYYMYTCDDQGRKRIDLDLKYFICWI